MSDKHAGREAMEARFDRLQKYERILIELVREFPSLVLGDDECPEQEISGADLVDAITYVLQDQEALKGHARAALAKGAEL